MSNILNELGVDKQEFEWFDLAICRGMDTNLFFEKYETDVNIAKSIDEACLSCPVAKMCYESGIENNEYGVWGGIYLNAGSVDNSKNTHKTPEIWKKIKRRIYGK
jgi:hypothetical protein